MPLIHLQQWPDPVPVKRGSILDAALGAGVPYPHSCRAGECGACKTQLHSGEVKLDPCAPEALSEQERASGLILACRARPQTDVRIEWLSKSAAPAVCPLRKVLAEVTALEQATHDIVRVHIALRGEPLQFAAGQYARLCFAGLPPRPYSMANRPGNPLLEFHVRRVPNGKISNFVADELQPGDVLRFEGPFGSAHLQAGRDRPLLLVAGGSGLAPMLSILRAAVLAAPQQIHLYHGVRSMADLYDTDVIDVHAAVARVRRVAVLSAAAAERRCRAGFVHEAVAADFDSLEGHDIYVAGPPPMVDAVKRAVIERGAQPEHVSADPFYWANEQSPPAPKRLGKLLSWLRH